MIPYQFLENIADPAAIPPEGILSRTIHDDDQVRAVLFGFAASEELSEHTASMPAIIHIMHGEARLTLGETSMDVRAGAWAHMAAHLPHSIHAKTPVAMLLLMLKKST